MSASRRSDLRYKSKETLLTRDLKSAMNINIGSENTFLYFVTSLLVISFPHPVLHFV